jgi:hypothetical protein
MLTTKKWLAALSIFFPMFGRKSKRLLNSVRTNANTHFLKLELSNIFFQVGFFASAKVWGSVGWTVELILRTKKWLAALSIFSPCLGAKVKGF